MEDEQKMEEYFEDMKEFCRLVEEVRNSSKNF